jgi:hypothetical protein
MRDDGFHPPRRRAVPPLSSFVERAWGKERAALIMDRKRPGMGTEEYLSELRASLRMTDAMVSRHVNWILGVRPALVTWMPRRRERRRPN